MQFRTVKQFVTAAGEKFESLAEAQVAELTALLELPSQAAERILANKQKVVDVLSLTERSIPAARRINGAAPKKRAIKKHMAAQVPLPMAGQAEAEAVA